MYIDKLNCHAHKNIPYLHPVAFSCSFNVSFSLCQVIFATNKNASIFSRCKRNILDLSYYPIHISAKYQKEKSVVVPILY